MLAKFCDNTDGANIETNTKNDKGTIENVALDPDETIISLGYVDDIVRTVRGKPSCLFDAANSLHPNRQFTLEETNSEGNLQFAVPGFEQKCIAIESKTSRYRDYTEL